jgi:hypothetical protein
MSAQCCAPDKSLVRSSSGKVLYVAGPERAAPECHALAPRGKAFPHEEAAPVAHRLSSFMVLFALVNPLRTAR